MGGASSSPSPSSSSSKPTMSSPDLQTPAPEASPHPSDPATAPQDPDQPNNTTEETERNDDGEVEGEEGECGFCLFMKGGGCKDVFIEWEKCVQDAEKDEKDVVERCFEVTKALKTCMEAHADYYEPILRAEKDAEQRVAQELEKEQMDENVNSNVNQSESEVVN